MTPAARDRIAALEAALREAVKRLVVERAQWIDSCAAPDRATGAADLTSLNEWDKEILDEMDAILARWRALLGQPS